MKKFLGLALTAGLLICALCACGTKKGEPEIQNSPETTAAAVTTEPTVPATIPPDGSPNDVTYKGSYTGEVDANTVVASAGDAHLTNGVLQAYYWAEVAAYRQSGQTPAPDFERPLDTQVCEADSSVASWQQYFLRRALNNWHSAQALIQQGAEEGLPVEEAYQPNLQNYKKYLTDIPATKFLYRYESAFQPNTMHQAYLDEIPQLLETIAQEAGYADAAQLAQEAFGTTAADLETFAGDYNWGYMYYTNLSYFVETTDEEVEAYFTEHESAYQEAGITRSSGTYADIRHILLIPGGVFQDVITDPDTGEAIFGLEDPVTVEADGTVTCSEESWIACEERAQSLLNNWKHKTKATDALFADMANKESDDESTALDGGAYRHIRQGQLMPELDSWCFDESRQPGDTTILRSPYGVHILYYTGGTEIWYAEAGDDLIAEKQTDLLTAARAKFPAEIDYSAIILSQADGTVSTSDVLYPDVAHERFPEVPLYLQQDYPRTLYGGYKITTNGCGITTLAMLASYMADDELTPPEMCDRYGRYSFRNGTDGMIFINEPPVLGFYLQKKTYEPSEALKALEDGYIVVSIQHKGYWTRGGHYLVLEKLNEDGTVQVRDSNIYNYGKIKSHKQDRHAWGDIVAAGSGYWIFENKITSIPACARCGQSEGVVMRQDYICEKCDPAILRRTTYLTAAGE